MSRGSKGRQHTAVDGAGRCWKGVCAGQKSFSVRQPPPAFTVVWARAVDILLTP